MRRAIRSPVLQKSRLAKVGFFVPSFWVPYPSAATHRRQRFKRIEPSSPLQYGRHLTTSFFPEPASKLRSKHACK
jgi:hypothetical protein